MAYTFSQLAGFSTRPASSPEASDGRADRGYAIARGVADHCDLLHLEHFEAIIADSVVPLAVRRRGAEGVREFYGIDQSIDDAGEQIGHLGARHDRRGSKRLARIERPPNRVDLGLADQFLRGIHGLGRIALGIAGDDLDLAAL